MSAGRRLIGIGAALSLGAIAVLSLYRPTEPQPGPVAQVAQPVWTPLSWPFPIDQFGAGKALVCRAAHCGVETTLYLRAKLGSCNCETGIGDDDELHRMSDFDLIAPNASPAASGDSFSFGTLNGRRRTYFVADRSGRRTATVMALNDRCDMVVATLLHDAAVPQFASAENLVSLLDSAKVSAWAERALGL